MKRNFLMEWLHIFFKWVIIRKTDDKEWISALEVFEQKENMEKHFCREYYGNKNKELYKTVHMMLIPVGVVLNILALLIILIVYAVFK